MSIYKRKSGRWAVLVDVDPEPFRLLAEIPNAGRRLTKTIGTFSSRGDAEKQRARLVKDGNTQSLVIEENARGRRTLGTFRTQKEAERAEREALSARDRGSSIVPGVVTVAEILKQFLAGREDIGRELKTTTEYRRQARLYIVPHLGDRAVAKLRPAHVSEWVSTLLRGGGQSGRVLSAKTVHHAYSLLSAALRWAVRMELAARNVCEAVTAPTVPKSAAKAFDNAEIVALLSASAGSQWEAFIALALAIGARRAELLALTWADVDFATGSVTISKALCQIKGKVFVKGTKTGTTRTVPLARIAVEALRRQRARQAADKLRVGALYRHDPSDPIFTNEIGERLTPQAATDGFRKISVRAKVSSTRLHDLRHTAGSHMLADGIDVKTTSSVLGHASPGVTLAIYGHVLEGGMRAATDRLGARLEKIRDAG